MIKLTPNDVAFLFKALRSLPISFLVKDKVLNIYMPCSPTYAPGVYLISSQLFSTFLTWTWSHWLLYHFFNLPGMILPHTCTLGLLPKGVFFMISL